MDNMLNIKRLYTILNIGICDKLRCLFPFILSILSVMPFVMILHYAGFVFKEGSISISARITLLYIETAIIMFYAPFIIYGRSNRHKIKEIEAYLKPTLLERMISIVVFFSCILPVVFIVGYIVIDYLLLVLPGDLLTEGFLQNIKTAESFFKPLLILIILQSAFILGSTLFKRVQVILTMISLVIIVAIGALFLSFIIDNTKIDRVLNKNAVMLISASMGQDISSKTTKSLADYPSSGISKGFCFFPHEKIDIHFVMDNIQDDTTKVLGQNGEYTIIKIYDSFFNEDPDFKHYNHVESIKIVSTDGETIVDGLEYLGFDVMNSCLLYLILSIFYMMNLLGIYFSIRRDEVCRS